MPPRGINWKRPHTAIYQDNYKYGTDLYSGTLSDIQRKYTDSMSKTQLRSDRPDLSLSTFAGSNLGPSLPTPSAPAEPSPAVNAVAPKSASPIRELPKTSSGYHGSIFETMLNTALHSSYANDLSEEKTAPTAVSFARPVESPIKSTPKVEISKPKVAEPQRPTSLYDDAGLFTPMRKIIETAEEDLISKRKKKIGREPASPTPPQPQNNPSNPNYWKDQCRDLQTQVDVLTQALSDVSNKLKGELSIMKSNLKTEIGDLHLSLEQSSHQSSELQKTVKKQAGQLMELQTSYEDLQRHLQDSLEEVSGWQRRNQTLRKEMDRLRCEVEGTLQRSSNVTTA